jgi:ankyrin repeat protein
MDRTEGHLYTNYPIHEAAIKGDYEAARCALESGADINALDPSGRTVIACAVAGEE